MVTELSIEHLENDDGDGGDFIVATFRDGTTQFVELELFLDLAMLRGTDLDAYELQWQLVESLLERGAPLEVLES